MKFIKAIIRKRKDQRIDEEAASKRVQYLDMNIENK